MSLIARPFSALHNKFDPWGSVSMLHRFIRHRPSTYLQATPGVGRLSLRPHRQPFSSEVASNADHFAERKTNHIRAFSELYVLHYLHLYICTNCILHFILALVGHLLLLALPIELPARPHHPHPQHHHQSFRTPSPG